MAEEKNLQRLATEVAMFLTGRLRLAGIDVKIIDRETARRTYEQQRNDTEFFVAVVDTLWYKLKTNFYRDYKRFSPEEYRRETLVVPKGTTLNVPNLQMVDGNVIINEGATLIAPKLHTVVYELRLNYGAKLDAPNIESIGKSLIVDDTLDVPKLKNVGKNIIITEFSELNAPNLISVDGEITVNSDATLKVPSLQYVGDKLYIKKNTLDVPMLKSVGNLVVSAYGKVKAPNLTSIKDVLFVYSESELNAPVLVFVGGAMDVYEKAMLKIPNLRHIGGSLTFHRNAVLDVPMLEVINGSLKTKSNDVKLNAPKLQSIGGIGDFNILENENLNIPELQAIGDMVYDTTRANYFSLSNGTIYGYAVGNKIFLTPEGINPETPIHEYTHLWARAMERISPEEWLSFVNSLRGTEAWDEVCRDSDYRGIAGDDSRVASEVLARLTGRRGEEMLLAAAERGDGTVLDTVRLFREAVSSEVLPGLFGTSGRQVAEDMSLKALMDFCQARMGQKQAVDVPWAVNAFIQRERERRMDRSSTQVRAPGVRL